jgi:hypothetical protein
MRTKGSEMGDGTLDSLFNSLAGRELPGGCDDCNAVQIMREDVAVAGVWHLVIHHDDGCPALRSRRAGTN